MSNLFHLIKGELLRLYKYKILVAGILVSFIWIFIIAISEKNTVVGIIPLLIIMDAALMSIILIAASFYMEKQEGTIKSVLVTPIKLNELLISKIVAAIITTIVSTALVILSAFLIHDIKINLLLLLLYIVIIVISHVAIGLTITLYSKDFGAMLAYYFLYMILCFLPTIFYIMGIIPETLNEALLISPTYSAQVLVESLFKTIDLHLIIIGIVYLMILGFTLFFSVVFKKYQKYAIGG